jgi:hypothetical protein
MCRKNDAFVLSYYFIGMDSNNSSIVQLVKKDYQKMMFIMNALDGGWKVKKMENSYVFTKKHENRKEIFKEDYLETFILSNMRMK